MADPVIRGNSLYTIVDGPSWTEAEANSVKLGGHLATVNSIDENSFLTSAMILGNEAINNGSYRAAWIGYYDETQAGNYVWADGSSSSFNYWSPGVPDKSYGTEYYAALQFFGEWNDLPNDYWNFNVAPINSIKGIAETPIVIRGDSAYAIVQGPTWEEAEANAQKLGGHLVTINDVAENNFLYSDVIGSSSNEWGLWVGATDRNAEGTWTDTDGKTLQYTNFYSPEPNNLTWYDAAGEDYAAITTEQGLNGGKWADIGNRHPSDGVTRGIAEIKLTGTTPPTNLNLDDQANSVVVTGSGSGAADGTPFSSVQSIDLKGGNDTATIGTAGSLAGLLNGGSGTDTLNTNSSNNSLVINASGAGTVDGTAISNFETINTLAGNDSVTVNSSATALTLNTGDGTDSLTSTATTAEALNVSGMKCGTIGPITFSDLENVTLGSGNDLATITTGGSLTSLNAGSGTDTLNTNTSNNTLALSASGSGSVDGTLISNMEIVNLLAGDDTATIDLFNPATAAISLLLNGGDGNDVLDIKLNDQEFAELEDTDALLQLGAYLEDPTGKTLDIAFGYFTLSASGFESATFNHTIEFPDQPPEAPTLTTVAASASDSASASGLEGLKLDVGGAANVQAPVTLKSTSDATTVEGNVKSDAHATEVLGISDSTLHSASDLSVGSAIKSIVTGSAESTSGIAIANALVDIQHGLELTDINGVDALASGGSSTVISTSSLTATSSAQTVGDGISDSGPRRLDGAWANTIAEEHMGLGSSAPTGVLTLDSESNATVSTSMISKLSSTAIANDGLAVATSQLLSSTGIENLNVEVGGLGLVTAFNQGVFKADATSTTDDASAMGINKASVGILDSTFSFGIIDSTIMAKDFNTLHVSATSTGGDAWSKLQSSSTGLADLAGNHSITDAGSISAIASDQGFANSATVSGSATAFASQEAIGMSGYEVHNHSDLILTAQALVTSESNSSAVGGLGQ